MLLKYPFWVKNTKACFGFTLNLRTAELIIDFVFNAFWYLDVSYYPI